ATSAPSGSSGPPASASPRGRRRPSSWCPRWSRSCAACTPPRGARCGGSRRTCASACPASSRTSPARPARRWRRAARRPRSRIGRPAVQLVTFRRGRGEPKLGAVWHDSVLDLGGIAKDLAAQRGTIRRRRSGFPKSLLELIQGGEAAWALGRAAQDYGKALGGRQAIETLAQRRLAYPLKRTRLLAPIPAPARNVFCLGRNYADHAAERGAAVPDHPVYFTKPNTAVVGPGDDVVHHAVTKELDYEVELAVVIGIGGRDIPRAHAPRP